MSNSTAPALRRLLDAVHIYDIEEFLDRVFPPRWKGIAARIIETGVTMSAAVCPWGPRLTPIPPTRRIGDNSDDETALKSIIFRVHDCLHQLWGLPFPGDLASADDRYYYKRAQMVGEVAVLTLTEFVYCHWLYESFEELRPFIEKRNSIPMMLAHMQGKNTLQVAMRLDDLLHKKSRPRWVREDPVATAWVDDYVPMLEADREMIDRNWSAMQADPDCLESLALAPKARFGRDLDGLELTIWMIDDFEHLLSSSPEPDRPLAQFNRQRRELIRLPDAWAT